VLFGGVRLEASEVVEEPQGLRVELSGGGGGDTRGAWSPWRGRPCGARARHRRGVGEEPLPDLVAPHERGPFPTDLEVVATGIECLFAAWADAVSPSRFDGHPSPLAEGEGKLVAADLLAPIGGTVRPSGGSAVAASGRGGAPFCPAARPRASASNISGS
jgi:hypothetical protein